MKVLDLRCNNGHGFEGWFGSDDDYLSQNGRGLIECPMCADKAVTRMPSAPRLNLSGARAAPPALAAPSGAAVTAQAGATAAASPTAPAVKSPAMPDLQAAWLATVRHLVANTEDVGPRFAEEARRIHYGETPQRGIRGQATPDERNALQEEGIETMAVPVPRGLEGPLQ
jgi:hypothetical protein